MVSCSLQFFLEALGRCLSRFIVIQTEHHIMEAGVLFQHPVYGLAAGAAQGHIAMVRPAVRVQCQKREQVNGGLKHIEQAVLAHVVEAVLGLAALHVDLEGLALAVGAPLVGVSGDALPIRAHEDAVVVLCVLIQQAGPGEVGDHLPADVPLLQQVGVHPPHVCVGRRQGEGFGRFLLSRPRGGIGRRPVPQQELHGLLVAHAVVVLEEADRMAALPGGVVVPLAAPYGDAVPSRQPELPPGAEQLLPPPPQELLQIHGVGPLLLLVGKMNISSHSLFHRLCVVMLTASSWSSALWPRARRFSRSIRRRFLSMCRPAWMVSAADCSWKMRPMLWNSWSTHRAASAPAAARCVCPCWLDIGSGRP